MISQCIKFLFLFCSSLFFEAFRCVYFCLLSEPLFPITLHRCSGNLQRRSALSSFSFPVTPHSRLSLFPTASNGSLSQLTRNLSHPLTPFPPLVRPLITHSDVQKNHFAHLSVYSLLYLSVFTLILARFCLYLLIPRYHFHSSC